MKFSFRQWPLLGFLISILIHGSLLVLLMERTSREHLLTPEEPVEIEILQLKSKRGNPTALESASIKNTIRNRSKKKNKDKDKVVLNQLTSKPKWSLEGYNQRTHGSSLGGEGDDPNEEWGTGGRDLTRMTHPGLMNMIYNTINGLTFYPGVLAEKKMTGFVYARLVLKASGNCHWGKTWIRSRDKYFRVYILGVLKKACRQNFLLQMKGLRQVNVDLSFTFEITEGPGRDEMEQNNFSSGSALMFYRYSQQSQLEWSFGPFRGLFPAPVVNVDFVWLQRNWERYVEGLEDPLIRYENEKKKENDSL